MSYYYKDYTWIIHELADGVRYDPPLDPSFYDTTSHDRASNEDLADTTRLIKAVLEEWREWDIADAADYPDYPDLIEGRKPHQDQLIHLVQHVEAILRQRTECDTDDEALPVEEHCGDENESDDDESKSIPLPHEINNTVTTTPPPDILAPLPLPLSPNISVQLSQFCSHLPHNQQTPDILTPEPPPPKPNIPPDILLPQPHPLKPNITERLAHVRLRCSRMNITWRRVDVWRPFPDPFLTLSS